MRRWAFLLLLPLIPALQARLDAEAGVFRGQQEVLYVWSGERLRRLAPGFDALLADLYWLRTVQYFGEQRRYAREPTYDLLLPLIHVTTDLDPRLEIAYRYGAVFLCEPHPVGKGAPEEGIAVLEKGVRAMPGSWRLRQDLGYFRYVFLNDAEGGARVLFEASRLPGAPFYLESLAAAVVTKGSSRSTSRAIWQRLYEQAERGFMRDNALVNLQRLDALDQLDALDALAARFAAEHGRPPASLDELRRWRPLPDAALADPRGARFDYDPAAGRFWFSRTSLLWRPR